jgi:hypothetical protein
MADAGQLVELMLANMHTAMKVKTDPQLVDNIGRVIDSTGRVIDTGSIDATATTATDSTGPAVTTIIKLLA